MAEFLIRTKDGHGWPAIHRDRVAEVLTPQGWACVAVAGWGNHRLRCGDTEISFSAEDVGWHVSVEGLMPADVATQLVGAVAVQVAQETGELIQLINIS